MAGNSLQVEAKDIKIHFFFASQVKSYYQRSVEGAFGDGGAGMEKLCSLTNL